MTRFYILSAALLTLTGCNQITFDAVLQDAPEGGFWSAWGPSPEDIWIVGGQADAGVVMRGSDDTFAAIEIPENIPLLNWIHGTSSNDVWVGGLSGTLLHFDGNDWTDHSIETEEAFWGVYAVSPEEAYAVGGRSGWGGSQPLALRFDGDSWSHLDLPIEDSVASLFKVHHDGQDVWMVGAEGTVLVGNGDTFEALPSGVALDISTVHSRGDGEVVMVGGRETGIVLQGTRSEGVVQVAQTTSRLFGVHVLDSGDILLGGMRGYLGHMTLSEPEVENLQTPTDQLLHAIYGNNDAEVYAVGGNIGSITSDFTGTILRARAPKK